MNKSPLIKITIAGKINDPGFEQCRTTAYHLKSLHPELAFEVHPLFETQWDEYLKSSQSLKKGSFQLHKLSPLVFKNEDEYIGSTQNFMDWALFTYKYVDNTKQFIYQKKALSNHGKIMMDSPNRSFVFMDIKIGEDPAIKVMFELFNDICPKTSENFKQLCNGTFVNKDKHTLSYKNTLFHRIVKGAYIQGGNIKHTGPKESLSIYNGEFADESYHMKHQNIGMLGMCKRAGKPHTNECQFYVTIQAPLTFMDGKYVVFGRVIQGMRAFKMIEKLQTENERPKNDCKIVDCGSYTPPKKTMPVMKKK